MKYHHWCGNVSRLKVVRSIDIKELQAELRDDNLPARERLCIKKTIQLFQKGANRDIVEGATVVGATCIASTFEALDSMTFPIVILDEASQLLEPMSLVPLCRAAGEKLIMVGDPLQLAPPVTTKVDTTSANSGYTRTLFDRAVEVCYCSLTNWGGFDE